MNEIGVLPRAWEVATSLKLLLEDLSNYFCKKVPLSIHVKVNIKNPLSARDYLRNSYNDQIINPLLVAFLFFFSCIFFLLMTLIFHWQLLKCILGIFVIKNVKPYYDLCTFPLFYNKFASAS